MLCMVLTTKNGRFKVVLQDTNKNEGFSYPKRLQGYLPKRKLGVIDRIGALS